MAKLLNTTTCQQVHLSWGGVSTRTVRLEGGHGITDVQHAWASLMRTYPSLRVRFHERNGKILQELHSFHQVPELARIVLTPSRRVDIGRACIQPFGAVLIRAYYTPDVDGGDLTILAHDALLDEDGFGIVVDFLRRSLRGSKPIRVQKKADYVATVEALIEAERHGRSSSSEFWARHTGARGVTSAANLWRIELDQTHTQEVDESARHANVPASALVHAAFVILLHRLGMGDHPVVGSLTSLRDHPAVGREAVGQYTTVLPIAIDVCGQDSVATIVDRARSALIEAQEHKFMPLMELVRYGPAPSPAHDIAASDVMRIIEAFASNPGQTVGSLALSANPISIGRQDAIDIGDEPLSKSSWLTTRVADIWNSRTGRRADGAASPLVPLRPDGDGAPLFCVHWGMGTVRFLGDVADDFRFGHPLYGLEAIGYRGNARPLLSIKEMAERYVAEIRAVQPSGPYHLVGVCQGALIALDMARILRAEGEQMAPLALVKLPAQAPPYFDPGWGLDEMYVLVWELLRRTGNDIETRGDWARALAEMVEVGFYEPEDDPADLDRLAALYAACCLAQNRHEPAAYDGPVVIQHTFDKAHSLRATWEHLLPNHQLVLGEWDWVLDMVRDPRFYEMVRGILQYRWS